jgi:hypothetical protein
MEEPHLGVKFDGDVLLPRHAFAPNVIHVSPARRAVEDRIPPKYTRATFSYIAPECTCLRFGMRLRHIGLGSANLTREENTFNPLYFASRVTSDRR